MQSIEEVIEDKAKGQSTHLNIKYFYKIDSINSKIEQVQKYQLIHPKWCGVL